MKFIKYSFVVALLVTFTSCLKSRSDLGGILDDKGTIVSAIAEEQYINTDAQNVGGGYFFANANFNFSTRPNELVKFFTISVSQPRETKMTGGITYTVSAQDLLPIDETGLVTAPLPAGTISLAPVTIPASSANSTSMPVKFAVNKTGLDPDETYGARFKLVSASQGIISTLDSTIDVVFNQNYIQFVTVPALTNFNNSDYQADYDYSNDVVDPANQFSIHQRTARRYLKEVAPNQLGYEDSYLFPFLAPGAVAQTSLVANNTATGATTALFRPRFVLNASGVVTSVVNDNAIAAVTNIQLDPSGINKFTYTSNNEREFHVKYTFTFTTTINGVVTPRTVSVQEDFRYNKNQTMVLY